MKKVTINTKFVEEEIFIDVKYVEKEIENNMIIDSGAPSLINELNLVCELHPRGESR